MFVLWNSDTLNLNVSNRNFLIYSRKFAIESIFEWPNVFFILSNMSRGES